MAEESHGGKRARVTIVDRDGKPSKKHFTINAYPGNGELASRYPDWDKPGDRSRVLRQIDRVSDMAWEKRTKRK